MNSFDEALENKCHKSCYLLVAFGLGQDAKEARVRLLGHHAIGDLHQLEEGLVVDESVRRDRSEIVFEDMRQDEDGLAGFAGQGRALVLQLNSQRPRHALHEAHNLLDRIQMRRDND
jgi:hypothetical protein